jgi:hypothetical protein
VKKRHTPEQIVKMLRDADSHICGNNRTRIVYGYTDYDLFVRGIHSVWQIEQSWSGVS